MSALFVQKIFCEHLLCSIYLLSSVLGKHQRIKQRSFLHRKIQTRRKKERESDVRCALEKVKPRRIENVGDRKGRREWTAMAVPARMNPECSLQREEHVQRL